LGNGITLETAGTLANLKPMVPRLGYDGSRRSGYLVGQFGQLAGKGQTSMQSTTTERYKLPVRFGLGGVPLGNEFAVITEKVAYATLEAAWSAGVRYYDTSPWYGLGLCERRFGNFLQHQGPEGVCHLVQSGKAAQGVAAE
jgi:hypothetical protein